MEIVYQLHFKDIEYKKEGELMKFLTTLELEETEYANGLRDVMKDEDQKQLAVDIISLILKAYGPMHVETLLKLVD